MKRAVRGAIAVVALALSACATAPRPAPAPEPTQAEATSPAATATPTPAPPASAPTPAREDVPATTEPRPRPEAVDAWTELAGRMRFARCDDSASVRRWIRIYTASPTRFSAMLRRALPFLGYVQRETAARGLPGEFVLLPLVESSYVAFATTGNRPAGIWQFMPATARNFGLAVGPAYDGRLDVAAATRAALDYLAYLGTRFEQDWPLVNMAFNAGEYRVLGAIERAQRGGKPVQHDQLALSPITHEHFAKLTALSCIVREPDRWHIELPPPDSEPRAAALPLDAATDIALLAALAGSDEAMVARFNPAARNGRLPAGAIALLPEPVVARARDALAGVPPALRTGWRRVDAGARDWAALAGNGADAALLAAVNGAAKDAAPPKRVLVRSASVASPARDAVRAGDAAGRYAVRAGDSLWKIARRFRVTVAALLEWNALTAAHVLRPGQVLWVVAPR